MCQLHSWLLKCSATAGLLLSLHSVAQTSVVLYADDFETGFGNWVNLSSTDTNDWLRTSGSTPSSATGPAGGAGGSGYYLYFETSSGYAYSSGNSAILESPQLPGGDLRLSFDYHMYGSEIGQLAVDVYNSGIWTNNVWTLSGQQHSSASAAFAKAMVDMSGYAAEQLRFRATAVGGYHGDIALDNVVIEQLNLGPAAPVYTSNPTSKPAARVGNEYAQSLAGDVYDPNNDSITFTKQEGPDWLNIATDGTLTGTPAETDLGMNSFVIRASDGELSSDATLEIMVVASDSVIVLSTTDFETGLGSWVNVTNGDSYDWTRDSNGTPSTATGPATGADNSLFYAYLETSAGAAYNAGDSAILQSPGISSNNIYLAFQYHMYGTDIGSLSVDVLQQGNWIPVWNRTGQQQSSNIAAYTQANVDLSAYAVEKIRLRAQAKGGYNGDIAIDNLQISSGNLYPNIGDDNGNPNPPDYKVIFITNSGYTGNLGGLTGADAICQNEANAAGLPGTFKAFLSDNTISAASRLNHATQPYAMVDGTIIADNWADLIDRRINVPLNLSASGSSVAGYAWTGSNQDGSKATYYTSDYPSGYQLDLTCNNWTLETASFHYLGSRGKIGELTSWFDWWQNDGSSCTSHLALYCVQQ